MNFVSYLNLIFCILVFYVQSNTIQVSQDWWIITVILLIFPFINFIYLNNFIREAIDNTGFTQIGDLLSGDSLNGDEFGYSVDLSSDGSIVAISSAQGGDVFVYKRTIS